MLKTLLLVLAGLAAGFAIASWLQPSAPASVGSFSVDTTPPVLRVPAADTAASDARLASLESALATEAEQRADLKARVGELAAELAALRDSQRAAPGGPPGGFDPAVAAEARARFRRDPVALREEVQRRQVEQLVAGGFSPDRAEWINRRTQELRMESLQAEYDATREGRPLEGPAQLAGERTLRSELGDVEYEQYLKALNRPTSVPVLEVLASSPGERSGLKPGDEVIVYGGERVFDTRDLNALTLEGTAGESVAVDVLRDGQRIQLVMPRGPVGIVSGFRGPPGR